MRIAGSFFSSSGVIAGPLPERAFVDQIVRMEKALEGDLGVRWNWQAGLRPGDYFDRLADQAAGGVVFVLAVRDFQAGDHEQRRVHAAHDRYRAWFAALVIAALDDVAVLAFGEHHGREVALVGLHPVGAVIDPAGVRIAHDHHVASAEVVAAVMFVPARHGDFENVDVFGGAHVLHHRTGLHGHGRDRARFLHVAPPIVHEVDGARVRVEPQRDVDAAHRGENVGEDAVAARKAGHVVEQHGLVADLALIDVDDAADFLLALGALDVLHFARGAQVRDPGAQIAPVRRRLLFRRPSFNGRIHEGSVGWVERSETHHFCMR